MFRMRDLAIVILLLPVVIVLSILTASIASPFMCDDVANTCTYRATVVEPSKTVGGVALTNYKQTNIKTSLNGGAFATIVKPATAATGGGTVIQDVTFATIPCAITNFTVKASGVNTLGAEGPETAPVTVKRDRTVDPTCGPAAPTLTLN